MISGVSPSLQAQARGLEAIATLGIYASLYPALRHEQVDMGNGLAQGHHHLPGLKRSGEQHRQQVLGYLGFSAGRLDGQQPIFMVTDQLPESCLHTIKG